MATVDEFTGYWVSCRLQKTLMGGPFATFDIAKAAPEYRTNEMVEIAYANLEGDWYEVDQATGAIVGPES